MVCGGGENRINYIDTARGIAILLVVLGHCIGTLENPLNRWILSFHMPAFFFLSGMCAKKHPFSETGKFIKRKVVSILVPQVTLGCINLLFAIIVECFFLHEISVDEIIPYSYFTGWFLLVLFMCSVTFFLMINIVDLKNPVCFTSTILALLVISIILQYWKWNTVLHVEIVPMAMVFYLIGWMVVEYKSNFRRVKDRIINCGVWIYLLPIGVFISAVNTPVAMYINDYGNLTLFFLGALCGIVFLMCLAFNLQSSTLINYFGRNSIIIYILHFKIIETLHGLVNIVTNSGISNYEYPAFVGYYVFIIIAMIPITWICNRFCPVLFGKKKLHTIQNGLL